MARVLDIGVELLYIYWSLKDFVLIKMMRWYWLSVRDIKKYWWWVLKRYCKDVV